jgi:hypothetical protein
MAPTFVQDPAASRRRLLARTRAVRPDKGRVARRRRPTMGPTMGRRGFPTSCGARRGRDARRHRSRSLCSSSDRCWRTRRAGSRRAGPSGASISDHKSILESMTRCARPRTAADRRRCFVRCLMPLLLAGLRIRALLASPSPSLTMPTATEWSCGPSRSDDSFPAKAIARGRRSQPSPVRR